MMNEQNPNDRFLRDLTPEEEADLAAIIDQPGSLEWGASGDEVARDDLLKGMSDVVDKDKYIHPTHETLQ